MHGLQYHAEGRLSQVGEPEGATVTYDDDDDAGRVTRMTLLGDRTVIFGYDLNGNLGWVTPPGQPGQPGQSAHVMTYTAVDQLGSYQPPGYTPSAGAVTTCVYTPERRLDNVTRPDGQDINLIYDTASSAGGTPPTAGTPPTGGTPPAGQLQEVQVWPGAAQQPGSTELLSLALFCGDPAAPSSGERFAHLRQLTWHTGADPTPDVTLTFD